MAYISGGGQLASNRSPWRMSIIYDSFWSLINFIVLFFQTMIQPDLTKHGKGYQSSYSTRPKGGPDDFGPRRRMGGINRRSGPAPPPAAGGG